MLSVETTFLYKNYYTFIQTMTFMKSTFSILLVCIFIFSNKKLMPRHLLNSGRRLRRRCCQLYNTTTDGGFVMAGDTYSFGLSKSDDILITKFDGSGHLLWNRRYGSSNYDHAYCITATTDGGQCAVAWA